MAKFSIKMPDSVDVTYEARRAVVTNGYLHLLDENDQAVVIIPDGWWKACVRLSEEDTA